MDERLLTARVVDARQVAGEQHLEPLPMVLAGQLPIEETDAEALLVEQARGTER
jgi:hypothetical protein